MAGHTTITSQAQFDGIITSNQSVLVNFTADWCGPCRRIGPYFEQVAAVYAEKSSFAFVVVDKDQQLEIAAKYAVMAVPTFMLFEHGRPIDYCRGANIEGIHNLVNVAKERAKELRERQDKMQEIARQLQLIDEAMDAAMAGAYSEPLYTVEAMDVDMDVAREEPVYTVDEDATNEGERAGVQSETTREPLYTIDEQVTDEDEHPEVYYGQAL